MPIISYVVNVNPLLTDATTANVKLTDATTANVQLLNEFRGYIFRTLNDQRGWKKYGFIFNEIDDKVTLEQRRLYIELAPPATLQMVCGNKKMSCYVPSTHSIYINYNNWMGNSPMSTETNPGMSLEEYRIYVINHEVGHGLGLTHPMFYDENKKHPNYPQHPNGYTQCDPKRRNKRGSVMMQMTKGSDFISPCLPNCWPLDPEEYDELSERVPDVKLLNYKKIKEDHSKRTVLYRAIALILVIIFILVVKSYITGSPHSESVVGNKPNALPDAGIPL